MPVTPPSPTTTIIMFVLVRALVLPAHYSFAAMALNGFISGPGPYYQLAGAAPGSAGEVLTSGADGVGRWVVPGPPPSATAEFQPIIPRPGVFDPADDTTVLANATVNYRVLPATFFDSAGAQVAGSKVEVFVAELPLITQVTLVGGLAIPLPPVPRPIAFGDGPPFGGTVNISVDGQTTTYTWFVADSTGGVPFNQLTIKTGEVTATELRVEGFSFWYLSSSPAP